MSFKRGTKRKQSRRKTHMKRKRVPKSGSRVRKGTRPEQDFTKGTERREAVEDLSVREGL